MGVDDDELVGKGATDADEEAGVLFLEDDRVIGLIGADDVQAHPVGAVVVVIFGVVDGGGVIVPDVGTGRLGDDLGAILAGLADRG